MQIIRFAFSDDVLDDIVNGCSPSLWLICKQMKVQLILLLPLTQHHTCSGQCIIFQNCIRKTVANKLRSPNDQNNTPQSSFVHSSSLNTFNFTQLWDKRTQKLCITVANILFLRMTITVFPNLPSSTPAALNDRSTFGRRFQSHIPQVPIWQNIRIPSTVFLNFPYLLQQRKTIAISLDFGLSTFENHVLTESSILY